MIEFEFVKKRCAAVLCFALTVITAVRVCAAGELTVRLDGIAGSGSAVVDMSAAKPINVEDRTLVPLRAVCEAAGFKVGWNQGEQCVYIKLFADGQSEKPAERYGYSLMRATRIALPDTEPQYIYLELPVNNHSFALRYSYSDSDGEEIIYGKTVATDVPATFGEYGTIMIPLRSVMEAFSLDVGWEAETVTASVSIPSSPEVPENMHVLASDYKIPDNRTTKYAELVKAILDKEKGIDQPPEIQPAGIPSNVVVGKKIGNFKITHYCPCAICNGVADANTAWAGKIIPGQTIAVDPSVIGKLEWVYIEGYGLRRAEDSGGAIKGNKIDMAVADHQTAMKMGVVYRDVYAVSFK